jgi:AcrR family transcriptional regulator
VERDLPPRERILASATELFTAAGVRAVGVDTIIAHAGVAKASLYHHFPAKEALVVAWLQAERARWSSWVNEDVEAKTEAPLDRLHLFFEVLADHVAHPSFRGSPHLSVAAEFKEAGPIRETIQQHELDLQDYLRELVSGAGLRPPEVVAMQLHLLVAGALTLAMAVPDGGATARVGLGASRSIIEAARPSS